MDMLDQRTVAVEEHRRSKCGRADCSADRGTRSGYLAARALESLVGSDVEVIASPDPASHPADEPGEYLDAQVERPHRGDLAISLGLDDVEPAAGQVTGRLIRLLEERNVPSFPVQLGDPGAQALGFGARNRTTVSGSPCHR